MTGERVGAERVIVALDRGTTAENLELIAQLRGRARWFKVGMREFYGGGERVLEAVRASGARLFLDLKLHDIPQTVGSAAAVLSRWSPELLTVHASGGARMVRAAVDGSAVGTCVLAVTVLTSMEAEDLAPLGVSLGVDALVESLAASALGAGAGGVVCSAHEVSRLRALHPDAVLVTPGIRPVGAAAGDQRRVMGPGEAVAAGSSLLVVGRPIGEASDPALAFDGIVGAVVGDE